MNLESQRSGAREMRLHRIQKGAILPDMATENAQLEKVAKTLFLLGKFKEKHDLAKPLLSLRGIFKGIKVSEKTIKAARRSLFRR